MTVQMTLRQNGATPVHNDFDYDPVTGDAIFYLKSFSEVAVVAEPSKWEGNRDYSWYDADATEFEIANADQLAGLSAIVGGMDGQTQDSFNGKTVKLIADINLGDKESENNPDIIFYPIGYWNDEGTYEKTGTDISSGFYTFEGTFDGNGNTISNFYQNTWEMKGDHDWYSPEEQYYRDGMGLFGKVYGGTVKNLTVKNFSSDGEITTTGVIASYADGATFENIAIFNCNPRVYNIGNGGIVGCVGWYAKDAGLKTTFTNITVDNSNKISALWGSYDVACGGIVGQYYPTSGQSAAEYPVNAGMHFENCHVSAQMDVYNDVCANYQYYAYRYTGMLIGSVRENETIDGHVYPKMDGITASGCTVHFGDWNDYYYCELVANSLASYTHDHQMSRLEQVESVDVENMKVTSLDDKTTDIPTSGRVNYVVVKAKDANGMWIHGDGHEYAECYHFVDGAVWNHEDAGYHNGKNGEKFIDENKDGVADLKEDKQLIYREFNNLVTGYGWGVTTKGVGDLAGVTILDRAEGSSVVKFEGDVTALENNTVIKFSDIFSFVDNGVALVPGALNVGITNLDENNPVSATIVYDKDNWENGTITFTGAGKVNITIQDYYFCTPTTITVNIIAHTHSYDNACDTECNECGEIREVGDHVYDNDCDNTCNNCGETREVGDHEYDNNCDTTCNNCGAERTIQHTAGKEADCENAQVCTVCGKTLKEALGHTEVIDAAEAPTCTETGLTEGSHCSVCDEVLVAQEEVAALGHTAGSEANCLEDQTCTVCGTVLVAAFGHSYDKLVTKPTCTEDGYTTYTCKCGDTYIGDEVVALGHVENKFTGDFLYRVGNQNAFDIRYLFNTEKRSIDKIEYEQIAGNATVTLTGTSIKFSGTGVIKVKIPGCDECGIVLEVVDATNLIEATGTTSGGNFVFVKDVETDNYVNYWNCTLYGNGFTYSLKGAPTAYNSKQGKGVIIVKNAVLDNLVIVGDVYDQYGAFTNNDYYNTVIDVITGGQTIIQNCYISGCAAPVRARDSVTIVDSTLYGGAVGNLIIEAGTVTLEDVITANFDDGRSVVGMGIVIHSDATDSAKLVLNGTLTQYNFISESKVPTDTYAEKLHEAMFGNSCSKYHFGSSPNRYVNTGIISLTALFNAEDITDDANTDYVGTAVTVNGVNGYVYTQLNTSGSVNNGYNKENDVHIATTQGAVPPSYSFDYTNKNYVAKQDGSNDYCYEGNGKVNISMDEGDTFNWDTSILTLGKGITNYTVAMNGMDYTGKSIAFNTTGDYTVTYTYTDNNNYKLDANGNITTYSVNYTKTIDIVVAVVEASTKHAEFTFGDDNIASTTVTIGNDTYVMPNVSATSSTIGSTTVSGQTIYYPIVEIIMSDGKTSHSSGWYAYFPVFSKAVTITDYAEQGKGDKLTPYNASTTTMPENLSVVGDAKTLFKYQSGSNAGETPVVKNNILVYSSAKIEAKRNEYNTVVQYSYTDNAGSTYYYYIGYHAPAQSYTSCVTPEMRNSLFGTTRQESLTKHPLLILLTIMA